MVRFFITALSLILLTSPFSVRAQEAGTYKSFNKFVRLVPGIDFYASKRELVTPYVTPATQAIERLKALLGDNLPKGAIFICSTLEQKDSIYEPMVLKMGYGWTLTVETPEIRAEQMMARMKSTMGDDISPELLERFKTRQPTMMASAENRVVTDTLRKMAYAVIQTSFAKNLRYRSSRLNDMGKSPLPDWLDIGIGAYTTGEDPNVAYLQQNMEQTFPIEDVLTMSRPFVASTFIQGSDSGSSGGMSGSRGGDRSGAGSQGFPSGGFSGMGQGGFPASGFNGMSQGSGPPAGFGGGGQGGPGGNGGQRGGSPRTIPKDEQDQMLFDGQASTFFSFLLEKVGIEKVKELLKAVAQEDIEGRDFIARSDMLGDDYNKIEEEWIGWVQDLKPQPAFSRDGMPPKVENN